MQDARPASGTAMPSTPNLPAVPGNGRRPVKLGIIGAGSVAEMYHLPVLSAIPRLSWRGSAIPEQSVRHGLRAPKFRRSMKICVTVPKWMRSWLACLSVTGSRSASRSPKRNGASSSKSVRHRLHPTRLDPPARRGDGSPSECRVHAPILWGSHVGSGPDRAS